MRMSREHVATCSHCSWYIWYHTSLGTYFADCSHLNKLWAKHSDKYTGTILWQRKRVLTYGRNLKSWTIVSSDTMNREGSVRESNATTLRQSRRACQLVATRDRLCILVGSGQFPPVSSGRSRLLPQVPTRWKSMDYTNLVSLSENMLDCFLF